MINVLLENQIILLLFVTFLCIGTYIYSKKSFSKIIGIFTLIFVSAFTIFRPLLLNVFPVFENVFKIFQYQGIPSLKDKFVFLPFIFSCLLIVSIVYMLLVIFKEKNLLPTILFLIGVASRFIIGFSPTIFISGNRTAFFLSMAILVNILFIIYKLYEDKKIKKQYDIILKSTLLVLAVLNYLNIFISI